MPDEPPSPPSDGDEVRTAEVIAALCLATDLGMGFPLEHGLHSTLFAMRLCDSLGVDRETAAQTYYGCLLFYIGCTADAEVAADIFDEGALLAHFAPVMFGTRAETMGGIMRALADPGSGRAMRAVQVASRLPRAVRGHRRHIDALCEVAQLLSDRLGMPRPVRDLWVQLTERWDGKGEPAGISGAQIELPLRIMHVARDAAFQQLVGGVDHAARVVRERAGAAFDPAIATRLADEAADIMAHRRQPVCVGRDPGRRARAPTDPARPGDRPSARRDGRLRRPRIPLPGWPFGWCGGARDVRRAAGVVSRNPTWWRCGGRHSSTTWGASPSPPASGRSPRR